MKSFAKICALLYDYISNYHYKSIAQFGDNISEYNCNFNKVSMFYVTFL